MTSVQIPLSIAAALPNLTVLDITNDVQREVAAGGGSGIAYVSPNGDPSLIRVQERETGFFSDLECLLERLVPLQAGDRERLVSLLLGPRTEQIPCRARISRKSQYLSQSGSPIRMSMSPTLCVCPARNLARLPTIVS